MGDYSAIGEAVEKTLVLMFCLLCVFVPLGIWKLIDLFLWVWDHTSFSFGG